MSNEILEEQYNKYLESLTLTTLRQLGRRKEVSPSIRTANKPELIAGIVDILMGRTQPVPSSGRGAPVKQSYLDPRVIPNLDKIRLKYGTEGGEEKEEEEQTSSAEPEEKPKGYKLFSPLAELRNEKEHVYSGILEIMQNGYGFLRARNCQPTNGEDVFIPAQFIHNFRLREGDFVACTARPSIKNDSAAIEELLSVNGYAPGEYEERAFFDSLTACYPNEKIELSRRSDNISLRLLDLFVPIGKGQRALIIAPPKVGKTTMLKDIARSIAQNEPGIKLIVLLIDERPEEVTDFRSSVAKAEVVYSTFDEGADHHVRAAELTIAHAKRMAEQGDDVVILLDSLTKLTRAYNYIAESTGKTLSGGLDAAALAEPKRFFGAARNTLERGSITILATALVDTGSRMDDVIYEEFKGTGNADIFLSRDLAERRIFPAVDVRRSGTRKEELLLSKEELAGVYKLRERGITENVEGILEMLKKTDGNKDFLERLGEWLKVYKTK